MNIYYFIITKDSYFIFQIQKTWQEVQKLGLSENKPRTDYSSSVKGPRVFPEEGSKEPGPNL